MSLGEAEPYPFPQGVLGSDLSEAMAYWKAQSPSYLSHHRARCCEIAKAWFTALDYSFDSLQGPAGMIAGPRWILDRFAWGPSPWPLHWCEAVESLRLDCGALSAFAREIYLQRNVTAAPAQFIQRYSKQAVASWRSQWASGLDHFDWLAQDHIYHEAVAVFYDGAGVRIWDPSNGRWIAHDHTKGYGSTVEIKVTPPSPALDGAVTRWGDRTLRLGAWNNIEDAAVADRPERVPAVNP